MSAFALNKYTFPDLFYKWEQETPDAPFLRQPFGNRWEVLTYKQAGEQIRRIASKLKQFPKGTHIGLISKNCQHWVMADLAISMAGHVSVPLFPTLTANQLRDVLTKGDVKYLFVGKLDEWATRSVGVPEHVKIIRFPHYPGNAEVEAEWDWDTLLETFEPLEGNPSPKLEDTWTILFTSGTTGSPKGVVHDHASTAHLAQNELTHDDTETGKMRPARFFSFLPLNHVAERTAVELMCILRGGSVSFVESQDTFVQNLKDTRPTLFFAVPRIWTKLQSGIFEKISAQRLSFLLQIPVLAQLIKSRIIKNLGLDNAQAIFSAAAPLPESLKRWYRKLGIDIRDVYGMTETNGPVTIMPSMHDRLDAVGIPMGNAKVRVEPDTNEIHLYAPWNMKGYYKDPDLTHQVLKEGWVRTGDQGEITPEGMVRIIGRVNDPFKSSKGKFIIPNLIEMEFGDNELLDQVCVVGRGLPQPLLLCTLSEVGQSVSKSELEERLTKTVEQVNQTLANYQRLNKAIVVQGEWTVDNEVLTPTLKVKRRVIADRYSSRYEEWDSATAMVLWE